MLFWGSELTWRVPGLGPGHGLRGLWGSNPRLPVFIPRQEGSFVDKMYCLVL